MLIELVIFTAVGFFVGLWTPELIRFLTRDKS